MKFGLENISRLCEALGRPERSFQSVIVAGTNGKGSVTAMVHRGLVAAGHAAARYTSPHLERIEERFVIGLNEVGAGELEAAAQAVRAAIERLQQAGDRAAPPTFFECVTAVAFELFRRAGVRIAVLEVGLGGRLDATNVVTPIAAAITSIDFDHEALLGRTLQDIAFEKAGIIKPGIPVVCGDLRPEAESVIRRACQERAARFVPAGSFSETSARLRLDAPGLEGAHQRTNAAVAARLLDELDALGFGVDDGAIRTGLTEVVWPGRLERFEFENADILIDAAHNPAGARALAMYVQDAGWTGSALVFGAMQDKNVAGMLAELAPVFAEVVCTTAATARAMDAQTVAGFAAAVPHAAWQISVVPSPDAALSHAIRRSSRVVVAGSIFLIGPVRGILRAR